MPSRISVPFLMADTEPVQSPTQSRLPRTGSWTVSRASWRSPSRPPPWSRDSRKESRVSAGPLGTHDTNAALGDKIVVQQDIGRVMKLARRRANRGRRDIVGSPCHPSQPANPLQSLPSRATPLANSSTSPTHLSLNKPLSSSSVLVPILILPSKASTPSLPQSALSCPS